MYFPPMESLDVSPRRNHKRNPGRKDLGTGSMGARGEENGSGTALAGKDLPELLIRYLSIGPQLFPGLALQWLKGYVYCGANPGNVMSKCKTTIIR